MSAPKSNIVKKGGKKKTGLGARKVKNINFDELEKDAKQQEKIKIAKEEKPTEEDLSSYYEKLSVDEKKSESKLKGMSENKKLQAERLGMAFGKSKEVGHSMSMKTIEQTKPTSNNRKYNNGNSDSDSEDHFYDALSSSRSRDRIIEGDWLYIGGKPKSTTNKKTEECTIEPIRMSHQAQSNIFMKNEPQASSKTTAHRSDKSSKSDNLQGIDRNSKSVSSAQLFPSNNSYQDEARLRNVEGRSGISSDDFYGRTSNNQSQSSISNMRNHVPDMYDVKEGVRQGVRSVAGKLSHYVGKLQEAIEERRY